jgi:hypothetical protein
MLGIYASSAPDIKGFRQKDGAMVAVACVSKILLESKKHKGVVESFVNSQVLPEFTSPCAFLRSRACWIVEYLDEINWEDLTTLEGLLHGLLQGLRDASLPVQVSASCSLRFLIGNEKLKHILQPLLPGIVQDYFRIMTRVRSISH